MPMVEAQQARARSGDRDTPPPSDPAPRPAQLAQEFLAALNKVLQLSDFSREDLFRD